MSVESKESQEGTPEEEVVVLDSGLATEEASEDVEGGVGDETDAGSADSDSEPERPPHEPSRRRIRIIGEDGTELNPKEFGYKIRGSEHEIWGERPVPMIGRRVKGSWTGKCVDWDIDGEKLVAIVKMDTSTLFVLPEPVPAPTLFDAVDPGRRLVSLINSHVAGCEECVPDGIRCELLQGLIAEHMETYPGLLDGQILSHFTSGGNDDEATEEVADESDLSDREPALD